MASQTHHLRVAIIGAGAMAREHIRVFRDIRGVEISAIWNRTRVKAEQLAREFNIPLVADDLDRLQSVSRAKLAIIAVYEPAIKRVMERALKQDWSILMEKPIGLNWEEAKKIADLAGALKRQVFVGLNRRWLSSTQAVLADIEGDPEPRFIHVQDQQSLDVARSIGHVEDVVANWMYANSVHLVDYVRIFGRGAVQNVQHIERWNPRKPGVVLATIKFDSGDIALYEGMWSGPGPWACTVTTARRRWEMRPLEKAAYQNAGERSLNSIEVSAWDAAFKPGFRLQAEKVVSALGGAAGAVELSDALHSMRLVHDLFAV